MKRRKRRTTMPAYKLLNMISTLPTFAPGRGHDITTTPVQQQPRFFGPHNNPAGKYN